jgi:hypothetical protein
MTRRVWLGFALLCLLQGSGLLLDQFMPPVLPGLLRLGVHDGLLACAFAALSHSRRRGQLWRLAGWGVVLFGVPQVLVAAAGGHVDGLVELLAGLLVPVVVVVVVAQSSGSFGDDGNPLQLLVPALAGLGGAVLALPFYLPSSGVGRAWLGAMVISAVVAGVAAVRVHAILQGGGTLRGAAVLFGAVGALALGFCWVDWSVTPVWNGVAAGFEVLRLVVVEAPTLLLTVWLLREMQPVRFAARPLAVLFVMIVESFVAVRPSVGWTMALGVLLIGGGAVGLLRADSRKIL